MAREEESNVGKKIKIGVCVMEKKVKCGSEVLYFFTSIFHMIFRARIPRKSYSTLLDLTSYYYLMR